MSISLTVKLLKPIAISVMLPKIGTTLREILGLSYTPLIMAKDYVNRTRVPLRSDTLTLESGMIFFEIVNEPEIASVGTYEVEHSLLSDVEQGVFAYVNIGSWRTPLEYALAAAVAASLGRELDTPIQDLATFYTPALSQSAESFINTIKVREPFDDYRVAAQTFYDALPRALRKETEGHPIT